MTTREIPVVRTGTANLASVLAALTRLGVTPVVTSDAELVARAEACVLPGVGAFAAGMQGLRAQDGLCEALLERIQRGAPLLTICLGLALLGRSSEEDPEVPGLGALDFGSHRIPTQVGDERLRVPHLGWNRVVPDAGCELLAEGHAYFAHSYRVERVPEGWHAARTEYGGSFVCALERGPQLACQFHPELSGAFGKGLLQRWLERSRAC